MSSNPILQLAQAVANIERLQMGIAHLQGRMDAGIQDVSEESVTALRLQLSVLKAAMGQARNQEAFWRQELNEMKEARKAQGDIAKG
jgi:hypothetical protein